MTNGGKKNGGVMEQGLRQMRGETLVLRNI